MDVQGAIQVYFAGEKAGGLVLAALGAIGLGWAGVLAQARYELRPFSLALGVGAILMLAIGVGLYLKTDGQVRDLVASLPGGLAAEIERMKQVQRNFVLIERVWLVLAAASAAIAVFLKAHSAAGQAALGALVFASALLCFDLIAERRGQLYLDALTERAPP